MIDIADFLAEFPKIRKNLPPEYQSIYTKHYQENREGTTTASSLAQKMETWLHKKVAEDVLDSGRSKSTLEIGAGTLNQLQYEPTSDCYDVIEPFEDLYKASPLLSRVRAVFRDIADVPQDRRYDRITAIATFEHVCNLPEVVARSALLLTENGSLRASIPSEGTPLWTLGWKLTTGIEFRARYGLDYGVIMRNEHVNSAKEIERVLRHFFQKVRGQCFGLSKSLSFYQYFECSEPNIRVSESYLDSLAR